MKPWAKLPKPNYCVKMKGKLLQKSTMPAIRRNRQNITSSDGLRRPSSPSVENITDDAYDTTYFPLPSTQFPAGTPIQSQVFFFIYNVIM